VTSKMPGAQRAVRRTHMKESQFVRASRPYLEAFGERDTGRRLQLRRRAMTPDAEIWGPNQVFSGYEQISEKIEGFHRNWRGCRLVLDTGFNIFLNTARNGCAIIGPDGTVRARGEAVVELASDGRIQRVLPYWEPLPPLPASWPHELAGPPRKPMVADSTVDQPDRR